MANPSISMPDALKSDIDDRRHASTSRSRYMTDAVRVRMLLEDRGEWESLLDQTESSTDDNVGTDESDEADN